MENISEKQLYFNSILINLEKVIYETKNNSNQIMKDIKIFTCDTHNIIMADINGFILKYKRRVFFEPNSLFELEVEYEVRLKFDARTTEEYKNNFNELRDLIDKKAEKAINMFGVASRASALISSITMQNNGNAVITQPSYAKIKE